MTEKRRAMRGNTHDPWPCCGKDGGMWGRAKNTICADCKTLIEEAKAARAALAGVRAEGNMQPYGWTSRDYAWPKFYGTDAEFPHGELHDELGKAFFRLVNAVSVPAPADVPHESPEVDEKAGMWAGQKRRKPWPNVLSDKGHHSTSWEWKTLVLMRPDVREAVDRLHQVIKAALGGVFQEGKHRGGSALIGLASGELSLDAFDETLMTRAERNERRR